MKNLLIVFVFFFIPTSIFAQTFDFTIQTDTVYFAQNPTTKHCYAYLNNTDTVAIDVDIIRVVNNSSPNWANGMCADTVCYFTSTDSIHVTIPPNGSVEFRPGFILFNATTIQVAEAIYEMKNKTDFSHQIVTHGFYAVNNDIISSNEKILLDKEFKVFPNPTSDFISIESNLSIEQLKLFDLEGRLILNNTKELKRLDISSLKNGIYLLEINSEKGKVVKRIVKK